jgi:hypothetical protein
MKSGDLLEADTFDNRVIKCRLVEIRGDTAIVCSEREWEKAGAEKREPVCLGWPLSSVRALNSTTQKAST